MANTDSLPWYRRPLIWLSLKIGTLGAAFDDVCVKVAVWLFWLGAAKQRTEYEALRAKMQAEIAEALIEALGPGAEIQGKTPTGGTVTWIKPPAKSEYKS